MARSGFLGRWLALLMFSLFLPSVLAGALAVFAGGGATTGPSGISADGDLRVNPANPAVLKARAIGIAAPGCAPPTFIAPADKDNPSAVIQVTVAVSRAALLGAPALNGVPLPVIPAGPPRGGRAGRRVHQDFDVPTAGLPSGGLLPGDTVTITVTVFDACGNTVTDTTTYTFTC